MDYFNLEEGSYGRPIFVSFFCFFRVDQCHTSVYCVNKKKEIDASFTHIVPRTVLYIIPVILENTLKNNDMYSLK